MVLPGKSHGQDPDELGQVGHATRGGALTPEPCGATNKVFGLGERAALPRQGGSSQLVFIWQSSFARSRASALP